ncbi:hypothetical protein ACHAXS_013534 [Conticribra weissflogii]
MKSLLNRSQRENVSAWKSLKIALALSREQMRENTNEPLFTNWGWSLIAWFHVATQHQPSTYQSNQFQELPSTPIIPSKSGKLARTTN